MKKGIITAIILTAALVTTGCGDIKSTSQDHEVSTLNTSSSFEQKTANETATADEDEIADDIIQEYENQKIVFMMWIASYDEPYSKGYFIDGKGMKHIYERPDTKPMYSVEDEYAYLIEHYDEFDTAEYFDNDTLKQCMECLFKVNADAKIRTDGTAIADAPEKSLYGIRMNDDQAEFIFLGSEPGISKRLDDASADKIFELFGDKWYLQ